MNSTVISISVWRLRNEFPSSSVTLMNSGVTAMGRLEDALFADVGIRHENLKVDGCENSSSATSAALWSRSTRCCFSTSWSLVVAKAPKAVVNVSVSP